MCVSHGWRVCNSRQTCEGQCAYSSTSSNPIIANSGDRPRILPVAAPKAAPTEAASHLSFRFFRQRKQKPKNFDIQHVKNFYFREQSTVEGVPKLNPLSSANHLAVRIRPFIQERAYRTGPPLYVTVIDH